MQRSRLILQLHLENHLLELYEEEFHKRKSECIQRYFLWGDQLGISQTFDLEAVYQLLAPWLDICFIRDVFRLIIFNFIHLGMVNALTICGMRQMEGEVEWHWFLYINAHQLNSWEKFHNLRNHLLFRHLRWPKQESVCGICNAVCPSQSWAFGNNHKFFERGHSEMKADSIHSSIERAKRSTKVYHPSQWDTVVSMAEKEILILWSH